MGTLYLCLLDINAANATHADSLFSVQSRNYTKDVLYSEPRRGTKWNIKRIPCLGVIKQTKKMLNFFLSICDSTLLNVIDFSYEFQKFLYYFHWSLSQLFIQTSVNRPWKHSHDTCATFCQVSVTDLGTFKQILQNHIKSHTHEPAVGSFITNSSMDCLEVVQEILQMDFFWFSIMNHSSGHSNI